MFYNLTQTCCYICRIFLCSCRLQRAAPAVRGYIPTGHFSAEIFASDGAKTTCGEGRKTELLKKVLYSRAGGSAYDAKLIAAIEVAAQPSPRQRSVIAGHLGMLYYRGWRGLTRCWRWLIIATPADSHLSTGRSAMSQSLRAIIARCCCLVTVIAACCLVPANALLAQTGKPQRPNIVYILADDFGYGDAKCFNPDGKIPTPNIDRLAAEGMKFTDAHSGSAVCSPTRYGILTGRYAWRTKLRRGVLGPYDPPLIAAGRPTVASLLKANGYHTACIGKWHLGWDWPKVNGEVVFDKPIAGGPTTRGFDYYFGTDVPNYPPYCFIHNDRTVGQPTGMKEVRDLNGRPGPSLPDWKFDAILPTLAAKAVDYIGERAKEKDKPFFLYFPLTSPHEPIAPSAKFRGKSGINDLADFFMESDWAVGEVLAALDKHELSANTLFFFTCDNGHATYTGLKPLTDAGHKVSGPYRGFKTDIWEGGHRVPFIARYPDKIKAGSTCDATICHTNLLATCLDVLGKPIPLDAAEDSFSIWPLLQG